MMLNKKEIKEYNGNKYSVTTYQPIKPRTFFDFCAGIGGGRLGLEHNGLKCLGFSEINSAAETTYRKLHDCENEPNFGDLREIDSIKLPDFDLMIAGFPCQAFSVMGAQKGFSDERGQIIYYLADILKAKKPPYFILENVKGLLTHDKGNTLKTIIEILNEAGYKVFYKVLNSFDFGVPQMRERIYFVGIRDDIAHKNEFKWPVSQRNADISNYLISKQNELSHSTMLWLNKYNGNKYNNGEHDFSELLKNEYLVLDVRQSDLRKYKNKVPTLRAARQGIIYIRDGKYRSLTGYEALLLQGFTKEYANKVLNSVPNSILLFQAGNAMTVNVINSICKCLFDYLGV